MSITTAFLSIGFLGLLSSMVVFLASYTERKFYQLLADLYSLWEEERRRFKLGADEYRRRMEEVEGLLPNTRWLRRMLSVACTLEVAGIALYCYALVALYKGWQTVPFLLRAFVFSAFLFICGGFFAYYVNRKVSASVDRVGAYVRGLYEKGSGGA